MRILITGAQGQLCHALQQVLAEEDLILKDLPEFDLMQSESDSRSWPSPYFSFWCAALIKISNMATGHA